MKLEKIICFIDEAVLFPKLFWVPLLVTRIEKYFTFQRIKLLVLTLSGPSFQA